MEEYEKSKKKQMKPDFLDMVPWYSGYVFPSTFFFLLDGLGSGDELKETFEILALTLYWLHVSEHLQICSRQPLTSWYR